MVPKVSKQLDKFEFPSREIGKSMSDNVTTKFCTACGKALIETAVICPGCGSPTSRFGQNQGHTAVVPPRPYNPQAKDKTTAVLLAIFLGLWSYLYTFKADATIFWISIVTPPVTVLALIVFLSGRIERGHLLMAFSCAFSLVAIIRQASRPSSWFAGYPNS